MVKAVVLVALLMWMGLSMYATSMAGFSAGSTAVVAIFLSSSVGVEVVAYCFVGSGVSSAAILVAKGGVHGIHNVGDHGCCKSPEC